MKSNKNLNKNGIIKFCHFAPFLMPPCCPVVQRNQYGLNGLYRWSLKKHFYWIILESDRHIMEEKDFKVRVLSISFLCRSSQSCKYHVNLWTSLKEDQQSNIVKLSWNWSSEMVGVVIRSLKFNLPLLWWRLIAMIL